MKVFKVSLRIMARHKASLLLYFIMFTSIFLLISSFFATQEITDFSDVKPNFTIINRDEETPLIHGFTTYLQRHGTEITLKDEKQTLQDALFYHASEYILIIPEGFHTSLSSGTPDFLNTVSVSGTGNSYYLDNLVNQYWNLVKAYQKTNPQMDEADLAETVLETLSLEAPVETVSFSSSQPVHEVYSSYNRTQSYIILVLVLLCVSSVTLAFRKPEIHMRNLCSPLTVGTKNLGLFLYCTVISFSIWLLLNIVGFVFSAHYLQNTDIRLIGLLLLNSFIFTITALSIAMLVSYFITNNSLQNAFANFLSLALSFIGGVFVPLNFLNSNVIAVARFTPVYWYSLAASDICSLTALNTETLRPIWKSFGIELLYAAAVLCIALAVGKYKNKAEHSFGTTRTELDI